jgi:putative membrane protein
VTNAGVFVSDGPGIIWALAPIAFTILCVVIIISLVRSARSGRSHPRGSAALRTLEERYARGEIDRDEFLERRAVLLDDES